MSRKPFEIPKQTIWEAWKLVRANGGSFGVDRQSIDHFSKDLKSNLFRIWNRMSSGSYFPPPVRRVEIPKKDGRIRVLGIPTVGDRVAQTAVKLHFEPLVEPLFVQDSYGYRPGKSAHDALQVTRKRCWEYGYVFEFDIVGLFDNLSHELLLRAIEKHCDTRWIALYLKRWLEMEREVSPGVYERGMKGVPQGSIVGPVLSNLFMHYAFDVWMEKQFPKLPFCRFADDGLVHTHSLSDAIAVREALRTRLRELGLEMHDGKSRIICTSKKKLQTKEVERKFDFLGYEFRSKAGWNPKSKKSFTSFGPGPSPKSLKRIREQVREQWKLKSRFHLNLTDIARRVNPVIRGWFQYYHRFDRKGMHTFAKYLDEHLMKWAQRKFKNLRYRRLRTKDWLKRVYQKNPRLFAHWSHYAVA